MTTAATTCGRCGWAIARGEAICSRCGAEFATEHSGEVVGQKVVRATLTQTLEGQLLGNLRRVVLGEYEVIGRIGRGGMCAVYLAQDLILDRRVAIKVVMPELVSGFGIAQRRLRREARTAAGLSHPNIIPVYAVRETDDLVLLVMKYVEGRPLNVILKQTERLPVPVALSILQQVGAGLEYAHRRKVVHRDIKPANIMVDTDGWAVLADFGIAKVSDSQEITATGAAIGTPCYMSPEQCSGLPATAASDQYSLGIVAYEMLTGNPPFVGDSIASVITQHLFERPQPIDAAVPDCQPEMSDVILRMLEKSPDERWPSVKEALAQLYTTAPQVEAARTQMAEIVQGVPAVGPEYDFSTPRSPIISSAERPRSSGEHRDRPLLDNLLARWTIGALGVAGISLAVSLTVSQLSGNGNAPEGLPIVEETLSSPPPAAPITPEELSETDDESGNAQAAPQQTANASVGTASPRPATQTERRINQIVPAAPQGFGKILLGTRGFAAVFYVNGQVQGVINRLQSWPSPAGAVQLSIRADGCEAWDSTVVVQPGSEVRIGYRSPRCSQ